MEKDNNHIITECGRISIEELKKGKCKIFVMDEEEVKRYEKWRKEQKEIYAGAIGGEDSFEFTITSIGTIVVAKHGKNKINLTDFENW